MRKFMSGTIRKCQKSKGSNQYEWQAVVFYKDEEGKRRILTKMLGIPCDPPSEDERGRGRRASATGTGARRAYEALRAWREELVDYESKAERNETPTPSQSIVVADYVSRYIDSRSIEESTRENYQFLLRKIDRPMMQIPICELTPSIVRDWLAMLREEGLGASMLNKTFNLLKYACAWAVESGDLVKQPCLKSDTPKRNNHEPNPLDKDNISILREHLGRLRDSKPQLADIAVLGLNTGMRIGELGALRWQDIDGCEDGSFEGSIHVNNAIMRVKGGGALKPYPKNGHRRDVPINESIRTLLKVRREEALREVSDLKGCFVFANVGTPYKFPSVAYLGKQWEMFMGYVGDVVGVTGKKPRFHDLRDTFATQALLNHIDVITVAAILGHNDTATTYRHYARWMPGENKAAMDSMDDILGCD